MAISTFSVTVTTTGTPYQYLAKARNFDVKFVGQNTNLKEGITPEEGIMAALGSCETIVTSGVLDAHHQTANNFTLGLNLSNNTFHVNFFLDQMNLFTDIQKEIKNNSPVYDNMLRNIPVTISEIKIEEK